MLNANPIRGKKLQTRIVANFKNIVPHCRWRSFQNKSVS